MPKLAGLEPDAMARELDDVLSEVIYAKKNAGMYVDLEGDEVRGPERIGPEEVALGKKLRKMVVAWGVILQAPWSAISTRLGRRSQPGYSTDQGYGTGTGFAPEQGQA
jgi:hypothetical protein